MKKSTLTLLSFFIVTVLFAQDVRLNDSVIFINDKPVALYYKELNKSIPRYDMEVYSFTDQVLIKAEVIKFDAPIEELRPFFYYELSFPSIEDTLAIYVEDEAFPLVLGKIIRDYNLISGDHLNKSAVADLKAKHPGGAALLAKIRSFEDYLIATRYFNEQVSRDRSKPVQIINDRIIKQDGVTIGTIVQMQTFTETNIPIYTNTVKSSYGKPDVPTQVITDYKTYTSNETQFYLATGRKIENDMYNRVYYRSNNKKTTGLQLYELSRSKKQPQGSYTDLLLMKACYLVEAYLL